MEKNSISQIVGENIRTARRRIGMKGETLAKALSITKSAVSQLENGSIDIRVSTIFKVAEVLEVSIFELLSLQNDNISSVQNLKQVQDEMLRLEKSQIEDLSSNIQTLISILSHFRSTTY
ncbi:MAG: helix-turn-helix domain-containing protein [Sediminibacterium sp.]|nr:helix-turn-helix transcriptional regulator [uncultured Sediminibacterium sp.]